MFTCEKRCSKKRSCGRHKCGEMCCVVGHLWNHPFWKQQLQEIHFSCFFFFSFFFSSSNQDTEHKCTIICGYKLNCGLHRCQEVCHRGNCQPCWQTSEYLNHLLLPLCSLIDFVFTNAHSIRLFLPVQTYWCYFGSQYICWFLSRFWWAGLLLWWNCHVPTYPLWHQTTRVQKPLHTPAWLWSPRYPRHTDCCSMLKQC